MPITKKRISVTVKQSLIILIALGFLAGCSAKGNTDNQKRHTIQEQRNSALTTLFKQYPQTRSEIQHAAGYAVFSNTSNKILVVGFGNGYGVVKDNQSGKYTYMKMAQAGAGFGIGFKQGQIVMIFHTRAALESFIAHGIVIGGDAGAAAKYGKDGVVSPDASSLASNTVRSMGLKTAVSVYSLTENGLAIQAMVNGYKYWPDDELNAPTA
ncbi:YSC84-related protein [Edaphovirga cremea]|uniref:lipid-binding SYLF domain-containing protein n=1 Tax=Edaphovirga cremea TaxID=2267246 RepID=UPI00398A028E